MSKTKSISVLVSELQEENEQSKFLNKLFNQAVKHEFGYDVKELHKLIEKQELFEKRKAEKQGQQTDTERSYV